MSPNPLNSSMTLSTPAVERILDGLTPAQREAVTFGDGPLLIVAGAGTGKTAVLTRRIASLIATKQARPEEILALTFSEKAAAEMEERVDLLIPYGYAEVWVSTFHAFGDRLLREQALEVGLPPDYRVLTAAEQALFLREHLFALPLSHYRPLGNPTRHIEAFLTLVSRAKDEDVSPAEYLAYARRLEEEARENPGDAVCAERARKQRELAEVYRCYQELLALRGAVDFGDLIILPLTLLRENPAISLRYQERFRYILIDEFQDTNYAQWQLVKLLAARHGNVTVVGDDDQSIYRFRGAALSNIMDFVATYPEATRIVLRENYRSPQPLLDAARRLIRHNDPDRLEVKSGVDKTLYAVTSPPSTGPVHLHYDTLSAEADGVAALIEGKVQAGEYRYGECALLVRANKDAIPFLQSLTLRGIPWRFSGNRGLYSREEIRLLIAFLRSLADPEEGTSLFHLASSDLYRMPMADLLACSAYARRTHRSLAAVCEHAQEIPELESLSAEAEATLQKLQNDLAHYRDFARDHGVGEVLYHFLIEGGYLKRLAASGKGSDEGRLMNIARFFEQVKRAEEVLGGTHVPAFMEYLDLLLESGDDPATAEAPGDVDAVNVLTVHKAKGLEFPLVIMGSLVSDRFPSRSRRDALDLPADLIKDVVPPGDVHLQEERRLFYVGMTRAMRELYLTSAVDYGGGRPKKVGRFVLEALDLPRAVAPPRRSSPHEVIARHAPRPSVGAAEGTEGLPADRPLTVSHLQIDDYLTCPLKYKYVHILRVPIMPHHSVIYGKALHEALSAALRGKAAGRSLTEEQVLEVFERAWSSEGFLSREHEQMRCAAGREALRRFLREEEERPERPTAIEKEFSFLLDRDRVEGRWDRVDVREDAVVIIDYKSSEVHEQREADRRARESLQLAIYALAYQRAHGQIPDRVELRFIESGLVGTATKDEEDLKETEGLIRTVAAGIRAGDFTATPEYLRCSYCAFRQICPATASRSGE